MSSRLTSSLTVRGVFLLILAILALLVGSLVADPVLLTLSGAIFFLLASTGILARINLSKVEALLELPPRVHAGKSFNLAIRLTNKKNYLDSFQLALSLQLQRENHIASSAAWLRANNQALLQVPSTIMMRACVLEVPYQLSSRYPLGLYNVHRSSQIAASPPMLVYPRSLVPQELLRHGSASDIHPAQGNAFGDALGDIRGIRPWAPGDPAKKIHWSASARSLARGHGLRVKEFEPPGHQPRHCHILFHSYGKDRAILREDRFERALSLLAGTVKTLLPSGVNTTLYADFLGWLPQDCSSRPQFLECLALLAQTQRSMGSEAHELQSVLDNLATEEQIIIISDISPDHWLHLIKLPSHAIVIDIRQIRFARRKTQHRSALS